MRKVYRKISQIAGNVITVQAGGVGNQELASVEAPGFSSLAQVIRVEGDYVTMQVFSGTRGVPTDAEVRFVGHEAQTPFSEALLGRIFTGGGVPRDRGPALDDDLIPIVGPPVNPARRVIPRTMIRTGLPMIDVFNSLVESQKLPIFSVAGEPYNELLARIALNAEVDIIVLGGMGLKYDDYLYFRDTPRGGRRPVARHPLRAHRRRPGRRVPPGAGHAVSPWPSGSPSPASACSCCSPT